MDAVENYVVPTKEMNESMVFSNSTPEIATDAYIFRLTRYSFHKPADVVTLVDATILFERFFNSFKANYLGIHSFHRAFSTALAYAIYFREDEGCSSEYYAKVAGLEGDEKEFDRLWSYFWSKIWTDIEIDEEERAAKYKSIMQLNVQDPINFVFHDNRQQKEELSQYMEEHNLVFESMAEPEKFILLEGPDPTALAHVFRRRKTRVLRACGAAPALGNKRESTGEPK